MSCRILIALASLAWLPTSIFAQERAYTVDLMLQNEGIAEALFAPNGTQLLFERSIAYEQSRNFAWENAWGRERAVLSSVDVRGNAMPRPVSSDARERIWLGTYSPSGAQAAIGWFDGDVAKAGTYDLRTGKLRNFDFRINNSGTCAFECPYWLSEKEFIHYTVSAEAQQRQMGPTAYTDAITRRWAQQSWSGQHAAVTISGSGVYQNKAAEEGGTLLRVDAQTGATVALGSGLYWQLSLSPNRQRLATLRATGSLDLAGIAVDPVMGADKVMELAIHDFAARSAMPIVPCKSCNVTRDSLRWSPSGEKLFFGARVTRGGGQIHEHYIYDFRSGKLDVFSPQGVAFKTETDPLRGLYAIPFVWLSDEIPAVRVTIKAASRAQQDVYEWYAVPAVGAPVPLTNKLDAGSPLPLRTYVAVRRGQLLLMAGGELWQLSADGSRRNLTEAITEPLSAWCSVISYWREAGARPVCSGFPDDGVVRPVDASALAAGWLAFQILDNQGPTGNLLFLNIDSGQTARIVKPNPDAELVTASALALTAVYRSKGADGDRLLLAATGGKPRTLLHFNRHLAGVIGGTPVMLKRREPGETGDRIDWLLLPPTHRPGDKHPLLVYFYPDMMYSKQWHSDDLRSVSFLNQQIPASHGFAVLLASTKISTPMERGNPMIEMHEQLIRAAENAVSEGYADPVRWALMGHSYGGYGTYSVVTQTQRFKAAAAMAGVVNLSSAYAVGLSSERATGVASGLSYGAMWLEGGQGRMGVAPWQDPQRYIRNSPLFHADKIQTPLLIVHGDADIFNVNEAEQMFNALHRQGKNAQFLRYWGERHTIRSPANIRDLWRRIFDWLDTSLGVARD